MQASTGVPERRGADSRAPSSTFHQWLREDVSTRSETAQNRKRNHPPPPFLETSRISEVKPPEDRGAPRDDADYYAEKDRREAAAAAQSAMEAPFQPVLVQFDQR